MLLNPSAKSVRISSKSGKDFVLLCGCCGLLLALWLFSTSQYINVSLTCHFSLPSGKGCGGKVSSRPHDLDWADGGIETDSRSVGLMSFFGLETPWISAPSFMNAWNLHETFRIRLGEVQSEQTEGLDHRKKKNEPLQTCLLREKDKRMKCWLVFTSGVERSFCEKQLPVYGELSLRKKSFLKPKSPQTINLESSLNCMSINITFPLLSF